MKGNKPTKRCLEALTILKEKGHLSSRAFAEFFWPGHHMHRKISNQGNGACSGKAAWLAGGGYLNKLKKKGLVKTVNTDARLFQISDFGLETLATWGNNEGQ